MFQHFISFSPSPERHYTRLVPRNRSNSIEGGIAAETKDPLWFLTRQWQLGEFEEDDGGSLVDVKISATTSRLDHVSPNPENFGLEPELPLEVVVEDDFIGAPAWDSSHLEYKFKLNDEADLYTLEADEYYEGHLDWHDFVLEGDLPSEKKLEESKKNPDEFHLTPTPARFKGIPLSRFWRFEDDQVDLGDISRPDLNLLSMLLIEFSLIYSDNWYIVPISQPVGTLRYIDKIEVTDSFGDPTEILPIGGSRPTPEAKEEPKQELWSMYTLSESSGTKSAGAQLLFLPNTVVRALEGEAIEEVVLSRDEIANIVWAVEHKYCREAVNPNNQSDLRDRLQTALNRDDEKFDPPDPSGDNQYRLRSELPPNWIPYVPRIRSEGNQPVFRRARTDSKASFAKPQYSGVLLAESRIIYEEEIPASPIRLDRHWKVVAAGPEEWELVQKNGYWRLQRKDTRNLYAWVAREKKPAERQVPSQLKFDFIQRKVP